MPLYEYLCHDCHLKFEALRTFNQADKPMPCPRCQGKRTRRAISRFAAFSKEGEGGSRSLAGNPCSSCSSGSCSTCG